MKALRKQWQISGVKMRLIIIEGLEVILGSFKYTAMYMCGGLIASSGTENFRDWGLASIILCVLYLIVTGIWGGLYLTMGPEDLLEVDRSDLNSVTTSISEDDNEVDYRIVGDSFEVKLRCPRPYFETVKPLLEEFADEMFDAECADSDEED